MADHKELIPFLIKWEGGYVNDPDDAGGETNKGVTIGAWKAAGHDTTEYLENITVNGRTYDRVTKSLFEMTDDQWGYIMKKNYWDRWRGDDIINQSIANILVDWVWASGSYGVRIPQRLLGVEPDGIVGPITIEAVNGYNTPRELFMNIMEARKKYIEAIVDRRPKNAKYMRGWLNRIKSIMYAD